MAKHDYSVACASVWGSNPDLLSSDSMSVVLQNTGNSGLLQGSKHRDKCLPILILNRFYIVLWFLLHENLPLYYRNFSDLPFPCVVLLPSDFLPLCFCLGTCVIIVVVVNPERNKNSNSGLLEMFVTRCVYVCTVLICD